MIWAESTISKYSYNTSCLPVCAIVGVPEKTEPTENNATPSARQCHQTP